MDEKLREHTQKCFEEALATIIMRKGEKTAKELEFAEMLIHGLYHLHEMKTTPVTVVK